MRFLAALLVLTWVCHMQHAQEKWGVMRETIVAMARESPLIVVGELKINATRDGHTGTIQLREVLKGSLAATSVAFVSPPLDLAQETPHVWFLQPMDSGGWYIRTTGAPIGQSQVVIEVIRDGK